MTTSSRIRYQVGHIHSHQYRGHTNTLLLPKDKKDDGLRITEIGLYVNLSMVITKGLGGYVFNSRALFADSIHSLVDLITDILTFATIKWSLKPSSERFPNGYGKTESLGSLGVSSMLLTGGVLTGWSTCMALCRQLFPLSAEPEARWALSTHDDGQYHGLEDLGPNINAAWIAGGSIFVKEWLYRATLKVSREQNSTVLASNAYHHRVDSFTAFVALVLTACSNLMHNVQWLDSIGGLVISLMVIQSGWDICKSTLLELADAGVDNGTKASVWKAATKALESIDAASEEVHVCCVQGVKAGRNYLIDVELAVPGSWNINTISVVERMVRDSVVAEVIGVKRVGVHYVLNVADRPDNLPRFFSGILSE